MTATQRAHAVWAYTGYRDDGTPTSGTINAISEQAARSALIERGVIPVTIIEKPQSTLSGKQFHFRKPKVKKAEVADFARSLTDMTAAGLSPADAISFIARQQQPGTAMYRATSGVSSLTDSGESLPDAFRAHEEDFGVLTTAAIEAGDKAGKISESLDSLAEMLEGQVEMRQQVKKAMSYPLVVMCIAILALMLILTFIVPTFAKIFEDLGGKLPLPTRLELGASRLLRRFFPLVLASPFLLLWFGRWVKRTPEPRRVFDSLVLSLPVVGSRARSIVNTRISLTLATLLEAGVTLDEALELTANSAVNTLFVEAILDASHRVTEGAELHQALRPHDHLIDPVLIQLCEVGKETGGTAVACRRYGRMEQKRVTRSMETLTSALEPFLMAVVGIIVGGCLIGLYLPMFKVLELINQGNG